MFQQTIVCCGHPPPPHPPLQFVPHDQDYKYSPAARGGGGGGGVTDRREEKGRLKRREDRREEKMAGEFSDGEDSVVHEAELVDAAADTAVDLRLSPRNSKMQDRPREEISTHPGVLDQAAIDLDKQRRLTSLNGVKPKMSGHGLSLPLVLNTHDHMLGSYSSSGRI